MHREKVQYYRIDVHGAWPIRLVREERSQARLESGLPCSCSGNGGHTIVRGGRDLVIKSYLAVVLGAVQELRASLSYI